MSENLDKAKLIRQCCLDNAESLLSMAERELGKGADHLCFHLALLALEEVGKAGFVIASSAVLAGKGNTEQLGRWMESHEKEIFWAIWRPTSDLMGTHEEIEQSEHLAKTLHQRRILSLYTDPNNPQSPQDRMEEGEAQRLVQFVRARLELEKQTIIRAEYSDEEAETLKWFLRACEDEGKKKYIFGKVSMEKRAELKDGKAWINWLKEHFDAEDARLREIAEREFNRERPDAAEAGKPKYRLRVRIQTQSHEIANKAFKKWNETVEHIKLTKSDSKQMKPFAKGEILIDLDFPKSVNLAGLWDFGFFQIKTLVIAINIASRGLFWWNVPKDIETFYDSAKDLETGAGFKLTMGKRLSLDWDSVAHRFTLDEDVMTRVSAVCGHLFYEHEKLKEFLTKYAEAMGLFSKTDIHLRLEANAFERFFMALKGAMIAYGDWDGKSDFIEAAKKQFPEEMRDLENILKLALAQQDDPMKPHSITLTEVMAMKLCCDFYVEKKALEDAKSRAKTKKRSEKDDGAPK